MTAHEVRIKRRERVRALKRECINYKGGKCIHCGIEDECGEVYDFHHVTMSDAKMRELIKPSRSLDDLKHELDKCVLLCSNCHRKHHSRERDMLHALGKPAHNGGGRPVNQELRRRVIKMRKTMSVIQIGKKLGISRQAIYYHLQAA
jgi:hypothetical protein